MWDKVEVGGPPFSEVGAGHVNRCGRAERGEPEWRHCSSPSLPPSLPPSRDPAQVALADESLNSCLLQFKEPRCTEVLLSLSISQTLVFLPRVISETFLSSLYNRFFPNVWQTSVLKETVKVTSSGTFTFLNYLYFIFETHSFSVFCDWWWTNK